MCLAIPGEVVAIYPKHGMLFGEVRFGGVTREVCLHAQQDVECGEFVLVHVGFAIAKVDREEAARTWQLLRALGEDDADDAADPLALIRERQQPL